MTYGSCGCGSGRGIDVGRVRSFLTREEKVSMLKSKDDLEKEVQGVTERIKALENN